MNIKSNIQGLSLTKSFSKKIYLIYKKTNNQWDNLTLYLFSNDFFEMN